MVLLTTTSDRGFISEDYETLEATGFIERLLLKVKFQINPISNTRTS